MSQSYINVIGAGLAGSEAAYQIAQQAPQRRNAPSGFCHP